MNSQLSGILIGGVAAAVFFGLSGVFSKMSNQAGIGFGMYITLIGLAILLVGFVLLAAQPQMSLTWKSGLASLATGFAWAGGAVCVAFALQKFHTPLSKLVPLYNMNTLIAVLLALWIFGEWKQAKLAPLLIGAVLVIAGGVLVAQA